MATKHIKTKHKDVVILQHSSGGYTADLSYYRQVGGGYSVYVDKYLYYPKLTRYSVRHNNVVVRRCLTLTKARQYVKETFG